MSDVSDSDSDYNENEKILLNKYRNSKYDSEDENEEAIFNVGPDEDYDSDDIGDVLAESDIEGEEDDNDIPSDKAWGRSKKNYYSTDYVHPNTHNEKEIELAEYEREEAARLEEEFFATEAEFSTDYLKKIKAAEDLVEQKTEKEDQDLDAILLEELKENNKITKYLETIKEKIPNSKLKNFVKEFYNFIPNYNLEILMYFKMIADKTSIKTHPILEELEKSRELKKKLQSIIEKPELKRKFKELASLESVENESKKVKLNQHLSAENGQKKKLSSLEKMVQFAEKLNTDKVDKKEKKVDKKEKNDEEDEQDNSEEEIQEYVQENELDKRPITYQMAKNKGLTPYRKKEQRNPRVKYRNKFKKAKMRRKGAVREVRKEVKKYSGEMSGINMQTLKGIKLKV